MVTREQIRLRLRDYLVLLVVVVVYFLSMVSCLLWLRFTTRVLCPPGANVSFVFCVSAAKPAVPQVHVQISLPVVRLVRIASPALES